MNRRIEDDACVCRISINTSVTLLPNQFGDTAMVGLAS